MTTSTLVLASGSPRRARALTRLGVRFVVDPPDIHEEEQPGETPDDMVLRLAREKVGRAAPGTVRLAVDTTVVLDGKILGKPIDPIDAVAGLLRLQGRRHTVVSGWALAHGGGVTTGSVTTGVVLRAVERTEALAYVATGEPMDKAGSYAIQGFGSRFVATIEGSLGNVMGFPAEALVPRLRGAGVPVPVDELDLVTLRAR